jgi:hypothetical protein
MFPRSYFPAGAFAPTYFPPVDTTPVVPPQGSAWRTHKLPTSAEPWPLELDDEELLFWIL